MKAFLKSCIADFELPRSCSFLTYSANDARALTITPSTARSRERKNGSPLGNPFDCRNTSHSGNALPQYFWVEPRTKAWPASTMLGSIASASSSDCAPPAPVEG